jgi:hypothetical protein
VRTPPLLALVALALLAVASMGQSCDPAPSGEVAVASASTPDADGDLVPDWCDNCVDVANREQADRHGDAVGDACDCDFNGDGYCNSADANVFLADFATGVDLAGVGTDMNGDGVVDAADYASFEPGFSAGRTTERTKLPATTTTVHPDGTSTLTVEGPVLTTTQKNADGEEIATTYAEGFCWEQRRGDIDPPAGDVADGCSLAPSQLRLGLGLPTFPIDGNVNNPTDEVVSALTNGAVRCPNAAFGNWDKGGVPICGVDVPSADCNSAGRTGKNGLPCFDAATGDAMFCRPIDPDACDRDADCPDGQDCVAGTCAYRPWIPCTDAETDCPGGEDGDSCSQAFCSGLTNWRACELHDQCIDRCGYRKLHCDDQFRENLFRTCTNLRGREATACLDTCLVFAAAYAQHIDGFTDDDGTWTRTDYADEAGDCECCAPPAFAGGPPAVCGDGVCDAWAETCREGSCPQDCGPCQQGEPCLVDDDCPDDACLPTGVCGRLSAGSACAGDYQCGSDQCVAGLCIKRCGDDFCDGGEVCGSTNILHCNSDCGLCGTLDACTVDADCQSDVCVFTFCAQSPLPDGSPCDNASDCSSGTCTAFTCGANLPCTNHEACAGIGIEVCSFGFCLPGELPDGVPCTANDACQSGACNVGVCASEVPDGDVCSTDGACASGICELALCTQPLPDGDVCTRDAACSSGFCNPNTGHCAATDLSNGQACSANGQCASGICSAFVCVANASLPNGLPCSNHAACQSGICNAGFCSAGNRGLGDICTTDLACRSGSCAGVCLQSCGDDVCEGTELCGTSSKPLACNADCGRCANGETCVANANCSSGRCLAGLCAPTSFCGDLSCNGSETCSSCALDCGACCASNGTLCVTNGACCSGRCDLTCKSKLGRGASCNEDSDCTSGDCDSPNIFTSRTCQ